MYFNHFLEIIHTNIAFQFLKKTGQINLKLISTNSFKTDITFEISKAS